MHINDRVIWQHPIVTPALKGGVWVIDNIVGDVATIRRLDKVVPDRDVSIKSLVKAI